MIIAKRSSEGGIDVHFDAGECELFVKLALDAERARADGGLSRHQDAESYFSVSLALGNQIRALAEGEPSSSLQATG